MKKLFDLQAALNGADVVTRHGKKVTQLRKFQTTDNCNLVGVVKIGGHKSIMTWMQDGRRFAAADNPYDLFMEFDDIYDDDDGPITDENCHYRIPELMMQLACELGRFPDVKIDESFWEYVLAYSPIKDPNSHYCAVATTTFTEYGEKKHIELISRGGKRLFQRLNEGEMLNCMAETMHLDDLAFARAIEDALEEKNK